MKRLSRRTRAKVWICPGLAQGQEPSLAPAAPQGAAPPPPAGCVPRPTASPQPQALGLLSAQPVTFCTGKSPAVPWEELGRARVGAPRWERICSSHVWCVQSHQQPLFLFDFVLALTSLKETKGTNFIAWVSRALQTRQPRTADGQEHPAEEQQPGQNR